MPTFQIHLDNVCITHSNISVIISIIINIKHTEVQK